MPTELTWLGHGSWHIKINGNDVLLDPFISDNPAATANAEELPADVILVSHGHFDHVADVADIARRTAAQVVANFEIGQWFTNQHALDNVLGMNLGGGVQLECGHVKMTLAHHSSSLPDGTYGGNPGGFVLSAPEGNIYFACDTALFSEMRQIGDAGLALAVLPIGDLFTMGPDDAVAAVKLLRPKKVAPAHYNTWPPIEQDAAAWAGKVRSETDAEPLTPAVGQTIRL